MTRSEQQNIPAFSLLGYGAAVAIAIGVFVVAYMTALKVETA